MGTVGSRVMVLEAVSRKNFGGRLNDDMAFFWEVDWDSKLSQK